MGHMSSHLSGRKLWLIELSDLDVGMKEDMAVTNKMISSGFGSRTCSALHKMCFNSLWWPEVKGCDEIRHEGGDGHC